jgi:hypothetical protein
MAIDFSDPPHLWVRLLPEGPLYLALSGALFHDQLGQALRNPHLDPFFEPGRVTVAMLDMTGVPVLDELHALHLIAFVRRLLGAGCRRLTVATALGQTASLVGLLAELSTEFSHRIPLACFDQQAEASRWLFSGAPSPPSLAQAPTERASLAASSSTAAPTRLDPPAAATPSAPPSPPPRPRVAPLSSSAASTKPSAKPLLGGAVDRSAPLLPLLLPPSPSAVDLLHVRPLLPGLDHELPLIAITLGTAAPRFALLREPETPRSVTDELLAEATFHLERMEIPYEERNQGGVPIVAAQGVMAAEGLLSPRFLYEIQDRLQARRLLVGIPRHDLLLAAAPGPEAMQQLGALCDEHFRGVTPRGLSPRLFEVQEGKVTSLIPCHAAPLLDQPRR